MLDALLKRFDQLCEVVFGGHDVDHGPMTRVVEALIAELANSTFLWSRKQALPREFDHRRHSVDCPD